MILVNTPDYIEGTYKTVKIVEKANDILCKL